MRKIVGQILRSLGTEELELEKRPRTTRAPCKHFNRRMDKASDQHREKLSSKKNGAE